MKNSMKWLAGSLLMGALAVPVLAQQAPPDGPGAPGGGQGQGQDGGERRGGGGGRGGFDPARMMKMVQDRLGATDEEMTAIQPKIEKVFTLQRDAQGGRMGGMGGPGGGRGRDGGGQNGGGNGDQPQQAQSPVQEKSRALRELLQNKDASADDIKAKLTELREAKAKAKEDLTAAQTDLKSVLTQRQEAVLVTMGMLD